MHARIARRCVDLVMLVFLVAAISKLVDIPSFARSIGTWQYIPKWSIGIIALSIPVFELAAAVFWFLRIGPRLAIAVSGVMLVVFTATFAYHRRDPGPPPDCGCLGRIIEGS